MGDMSVVARPIWRTRLAVVLVAWIVTVVTATLAAARLMEVVPDGLAPVVIAAVFVVPPPVLLVWSLWSMLREPVTGWLAPTVLMGFLGAFVPLFEPLYQTGVRLNFEQRRPAYEQIAADARAGRLVGVPNPRGWIQGSRDDIRFRFRPADPGLIEFPWTNAYGVRAGVRYDDTPCVARPGYTCISRGDPLDGRFTYYARFF
jgi:hypothetical protein